MAEFGLCADEDGAGRKYSILIGAMAMKRVVLDQFHDVSGWGAVASGLAELRISQDRGPDGAAMRLDFDFKGGGGFVVARRLLSVPLPDAYAFSFKLRGAAPRNKF